VRIRRLLNSRILTYVTAIFICAALLILSDRWHENRTTIETLETSAARQRETIVLLRQTVKAQQTALARTRLVLTELCRTNSVILGLVDGTVSLFQSELREQAVAPDVLPAYRQALQTFQGFRTVLTQQTACQEVLQP
jgi:hypothetical protein